MAGRSYEVCRRIEAPASTVWALLTDSSSYGRWNTSVVSIEGVIEQGRTIKLVSVASPGRAFKLKVAEMRGPHHMVWSSGMPLGLFTGRRTYSITERGDAACDFRMTEAFSGPLAGLIGKTIPDLTDSFDLFADGLTAAAEGTTTT